MLTTPPIRVFVFEDDWMCREAIQSVIERTNGIEMVGAAAHAAQAVETTTALNPDVILKVIRKPAHHNSFGLTWREFEILRLIAEGLNNRAIAQALTIQEGTVANHVSNILFKINLNLADGMVVSIKEFYTRPYGARKKFHKLFLREPLACFIGIS